MAQIVNPAVPLRRPVFDPGPFCVRLVANSLALEQALLCLLRFSRINIISPVLPPTVCNLSQDGL